MSKLYNTIKLLCDEKEITGYKLCRELGIQPSILTDLKMGRKNSMKIETANKIANFFNVSVEYLMGETEKKNKPNTESDRLNDNDIKVALFGGDAKHISDKAWDEVKSFAQKVAEIEKLKKEYNEK